ncbi:MAG: FHA domain-containing protein [Zoogloeaceae bacterium]|jgi:hypothetical protein|nr:FHA domain-containing protein [Zoogloeaceae bacterium]
MVTIVVTEILGSGRLVGRQLGAKEVRYTMDRYFKRIEMVGASFRGSVNEIEQNQIDLTFPTLSEAGLAAIEIQYRISSLPPVSGVRLNVRIGIHMAETETDARNVAIQLMQLALPEQILCGREILLDQAQGIGVSMRDLHQTRLADGKEFQVVEVLWREDRMPVSLTTTSVLSHAEQDKEGAKSDDSALSAIDLGGSMPDLVLPNAKLKNKLCVRYQGKAFLLDEKTPFFTLGRDQSNDLVIHDSRVSRQHARIERKDDRYYLVDMSTNGTFVAIGNGPEAFLRKGRLLLEGHGILGFASSVSREDETKRVEYEFL